MSFVLLRAAATWATDAAGADQAGGWRSQPVAVASGAVCGSHGRFGLKRRSQLRRCAIASLLCASLASPPLRAAADTATIYVVRRAWHIDVGFAAGDVSVPLDFLTADFPNAQTVLFGFGDQRYLLSRRRRAPVVLRTLWPGDALILATAVDSSLSETFGPANVIALKITLRGLSTGQLRLWNSFKGHPDRPQALPGPYPRSFYYSAQARYSAVHTCNTWAAEILRASGVRVNSAGVVFAGQLWGQLEKLRDAPTRGPTPASLLRTP